MVGGGRDEAGGGVSRKRREGVARAQFPAALLAEPWIERVIDIEDRERKRRSLERRLTNARIGAFKAIADFDWAWPKRIDRPLIEELFSLAFVDDATTVPVLITTNKPFSEWADVFSSAACVVTLVDRLIHRSEIVQLDGESYRLREAKEQAAKRSKARSRRTTKSRASRGTRS